MPLDGSPDTRDRITVHTKGRSINQSKHDLNPLEFKEEIPLNSWSHQSEPDSQKLELPMYDKKRSKLKKLYEKMKGQSLKQQSSGSTKKGDPQIKGAWKSNVNDDELLEVKQDKNESDFDNSTIVQDLRVIDPCHFGGERNEYHGHHTVIHPTINRDERYPRPTPRTAWGSTQSSPDSSDCKLNSRHSAIKMWPKQTITRCADTPVKTQVEFLSDSAMDSDQEHMLNFPNSSSTLVASKKIMFKPTPFGFAPKPSSGDMTDDGLETLICSPDFTSMMETSQRRAAPDCITPTYLFAASSLVPLPVVVDHNQSMQ